MANKIDEMVETLLMINGGNVDDENVLALSAKSKELGPDASDEECVRAAFSVVDPHLAILLGAINPGGVDEDSEIVLSEEDQEYMKTSINEVKSFFDEQDWKYRTRELRPDLFVFDLQFGIEHGSLPLHVYIEADPKVCRVEAVLPISADAVYEYPLCKKLESLNYGARFGSFKYDERDGEVSYRHDFLATDGLNIGAFTIYFDYVYKKAVDNYEDIRRFCVGKFKKDEKNEMLKKISDLVNDISE